MLRLRGKSRLPRGSMHSTYALTCFHLRIQSADAKLSRSPVHSGHVLGCMNFRLHIGHSISVNLFSSLAMMSAYWSFPMSSSFPRYNCSPSHVIDQFSPIFFARSISNLSHVENSTGKGHLSLPLSFTNLSQSLTPCSSQFVGCLWLTQSYGFTFLTP